MPFVGGQSLRRALQVNGGVVGRTCLVAGTMRTEPTSPSAAASLLQLGSAGGSAPKGSGYHRRSHRQGALPLASLLEQL